MPLPVSYYTSITSYNTAASSKRTGSNSSNIHTNTNTNSSISNSINNKNKKMNNNHNSHLQQNMSYSNNKFERFEQWLRDNGAHFEMLELREYDVDGAGLAADAESDAGSSGGDNFDGSGSTCEEKKEPVYNRRRGTAEDDEDHEDHHDDDDDDEHDNGGGAGKRKQKKESEMRGVHARTHITPNTVCMSIPRRCLITVEMGQATAIGQAILHSDLDLDAPKHIFLMIYLLWDRAVNGPNSFFWPYYEILPQTLDNMPIFWTPEELAGLQGSYLLQQIADRNQAITDDYYAICQIAPELAQIATLDEFKWARMCVCSRNFGLQIDGHRTSALVPHADMLNHYRPRETKWTFDEDKQAFTITTLQHISAGSQVYDSYGQKCNHRFLLNYGFAVEDNRELDGFCPNEVPLELTLDPNDPLYAARLEFWTRGEILTSTSATTTATTIPSTQQLINGTGASSTAANCSMSAASILAQAAQAVSGGSSGGVGGSGRRSGGNGTMDTYSLQQQQLQLQQQQQQLANSVDGPLLVKRVRVCASNNENTKLLFSLLRTLACNEEELKAVSQPPQPSSLVTGTDSNSSNSVSNNSVTRALFGLPDMSGRGSTTTSFAHSMLGGNSAFGGIAASLQQQQHNTNNNFYIHHNNTSTTATAGSQQHHHHHNRTCRDIRHPISIRNERAAMRLLLEVIARQLSQYSTTLAQDLADLQDIVAFPRFSNKRHAKIQVRGEKEVLHHFCLWAQTALDVLDVMEEELKEERGSVEVQLNAAGRMVVTPHLNTTSVEDSIHCTDGFGEGRQQQQQQQSSSRSLSVSSASHQHLGFEYLIRRMEEDMDNGIHHTILRYCADVLGSLRREEFKSLRRQRSGLSPSASAAAAVPAAPVATSAAYSHPYTSTYAGSSKTNGSNNSNTSGGTSNSNSNRTTMGRGSSNMKSLGGYF